MDPPTWDTKLDMPTDENPSKPNAHSKPDMTLPYLLSLKGSFPPTCFYKPGLFSTIHSQFEQSSPVPVCISRKQINLLYYKLGGRIGMGDDIAHVSKKLHF